MSAVEEKKKEEKKEEKKEVEEKKEEESKEEEKEEDLEEEAEKKTPEEWRKAAQEFLKESKHAEAEKLADELESIDGKKLASIISPLLKEASEASSLASGLLLALAYPKDTAAHASFIESGGMNFLVSHLKTEDLQTLKNCLRLVGAITTKNKPADNVTSAEAALNAGLLKPIIALANHKDEFLSLYSAGLLRVFASFEGRAAVTFIPEISSAGGVPALCKLLEHDAPRTVRIVCSAIRYLAQDSGSADHFIELGALSLILTKIHMKPTEKVLLALVSTLASLASSEKSIKELCRDQAQEILLSLLKSEVEAVQELAIQVLRNASHSAAPLLQEKARESKLLAHLFDLLGSKNVKVLRHVTMTIANLIYNSVENQKEAEKAGILSKLISLLSHTNDYVKGNSLHAIKIYIHKHADHQNALLEATKNLSPIISLLGSSSYTVQENASLTILAAIENEKIRKEIVASALKQLLILLSSEVLSTQEAALTCVQSLVSEPGVKEALLKDKKSVSRVFQLMDSGRSKTIIRSCELLCALALTENKDILKMLEKEKAHETLKRLLTNPDFFLQKHAAYAAWAFTRKNSKNQGLMGKCGVLEALIAALENGSIPDHVKEYLAGALVSIVVDHSKNKNLMTGKGMKALIPLLSSPNLNLKANAAKAIWASSIENVKNQEAGRDSIVPLVPLLAIPETVGAAVGCISCLSTKNEKNQEVVREAGVIPELIKILNHYSLLFKEKDTDEVKKAQYLEILRSAFCSNCCCTEECTQCQGSQRRRYWTHIARVIFYQRWKVKGGSCFSPTTCFR